MYQRLKSLFFFLLLFLLHLQYYSHFTDDNNKIQGYIVNTTKREFLMKIQVCLFQDHAFICVYIYITILLPFIVVFAIQSLSAVSLFAIPCTAAHQTPLSMEFSRQEYWTGLSFPSPGYLPHLGQTWVSFIVSRFFTV